MPKHAHANAPESKNRYVVVVDRGEEKGGVKRIKFRERQAALNLAELLYRRNTKVRVLNPNGQEIYPCQ